jgi:hypothetical protein
MANKSTKLKPTRPEKDAEKRILSDKGMDVP